MRQWMLRITAFAERLIDELDGLDWPDSIKALQRNWIGRSEGAEVDFAIADRGPVNDERSRVFTTRRIRFTARPTWCSRPSIRWWMRSRHRGTAASGRGVPRADRIEERSRADGTGEGEDRRLHRRVCDQSGQRRANPDLDRRLRADRLRHRRDHGRAGARRARLGVRAEISAADPRSRRGGTALELEAAKRRAACRPLVCIAGRWLRSQFAHCSMACRRPTRSGELSTGWRNRASAQER